MCIYMLSSTLRHYGCIAYALNYNVFKCIKAYIIAKPHRHMLTQGMYVCIYAVGIHLYKICLQVTDFEQVPIQII